MASQLYCKIVDGSIVARERKDSPEVATGPDGNPVWRPYVNSTRPSHDAETQHAPVKSEVVEDTQVTETWADPVDKTSQELDAEVTAKATSAATQDIARVIKLLMTGQFNVVNEIRSAKGQSALTADQYLSWLSGLSTLPDAKFIAKMKDLLE